MDDMEKVLDGDASELYKMLHGTDTDYHKNILSESIEEEKNGTTASRAS